MSDNIPPTTPPEVNPAKPSAAKPTVGKRTVDPAAIRPAAARPGWFWRNLTKPFPAACKAELVISGSEIIFLRVTKARLKTTPIVIAASKNQSIRVGIVHLERLL